MAPLLPFARRGLPAPYIITPRTTDEAATGKATLLASGDLQVLIGAVRTAAPERRDLIDKFRELLD